MAEHALLVDEEDALLVRSHGVMVKAPQEVAVHDVEPCAADLVDGVAVRERVREAHDRGAGRLERAPVAQPVDRVEPLVRIADEGERQDLAGEVPSGALEEIGGHLDHLGLGVLECPVPGSYAVRVEAAEGAREAARKPDDDVRAAPIRGQVHLGPAERRQREPRRRLTDRRALESGDRRGLVFCAPVLLHRFTPFRGNAKAVQYISSRYYDDFRTVSRGDVQLFSGIPVKNGPREARKRYRAMPFSLKNRSAQG